MRMLAIALSAALLTVAGTGCDDPGVPPMEEESMPADPAAPGADEMPDQDYGPAQQDDNGTEGGLPESSGLPESPAPTDSAPGAGNP